MNQFFTRATNVKGDEATLKTKYSILFLPNPIKQEIKMPRIARGETVGGIYHIINRGNMRMQVFDDADDYEYFLELLEKACKREHVEVHAYCLMPNHFHLLIVQKEEKSLSRLIQWVMTSHVRYIEANALRAKLTRKAQDWKYGSLHERVENHREFLTEPYIELDEDWVKYVNTPMKEGELHNIRNSVNRQAPLGQEEWQLETAAKYGMLSTLNQRGRPSKDV